VTRFSRRDSNLAAFEADLNALAALGVTTIPESVQRAVRFGLNAEGRIAIDDFEIPVPGDVVISLKELVT
jgi:hypothetical protein